MKTFRNKLTFAETYLGEYQPGGVWLITEVAWPRSRDVTWRVDPRTGRWYPDGQ